MGIEVRHEGKALKNKVAVRRLKSNCKVRMKEMAPAFHPIEGSKALGIYGTFP